MGRKSKWETHVKPHLCEIEEWVQDYSEKYIAEELLNVSEKTFETYKKVHPELRKALKEGNKKLIGDLKQSLKKKAKGFYYDESRTYFKQEGKNGKETMIKETFHRYSQPDTGAIHLLLKNLDPDWRNDDMTTVELKREQNELAKQKFEAENW